MTPNNNIYPDQFTSPAGTPGPINWWLNPATGEHDPFITLAVDADGRLPLAAEYELIPGMTLLYAPPVVLCDDYAVMPEVLVVQEIDRFVADLGAALDKVDDTSSEQLGILFVAIGLLWAVAWLVWRWLL